MKIQRQIIALGGGAFSAAPHNPVLDRYILAQSKKTKPKVCFISTACGDAQDKIDLFYQVYQKLDCEPSHLALYRGPLGSLETFVMEKDVLFIGGGNTRNMLALWREWGLDLIVKKAWESGIVLGGVSAGSICWFEQGVTDSVPGDLTVLKCLGFLKGSNCVLYDGEVNRRPFYQKFVTQHEIQPGLAADDGVGLHYINDTLHKVVSSRPNAKAYQLGFDQQGQFKEEVIHPELIS